MLRRPQRKLSSLVLFLLAFGAVVAHAQVEWRPVSQAELDEDKPVVEADADAEALFWEIKLDDEKRKKLFYHHYVRVKIYNDRGREKFAKFELPYVKNLTIEDVAARVIKRDGTIVNVGPGDIFEQEILKAGKFFVRAKTFAMQGIEPGAIVEYQYKETIKGDSAENERLIFQQDIPVRRMTYFIRPLKNLSLRVSYHNMTAGTFTDAGDGWKTYTATNIPALREEPQMPPKSEVRRWALLNYSSFNFSWVFFGYTMTHLFMEATKEDKEIKAKAAELTAGVHDDADKLRAIFEFTQKRIRNVTFDRTMTDEQRSKIENKRAADTLRRGMGHSAEIDLLFAALVRAAGMKSAIVFSGDRSESFADPQGSTDPRLVHWAGIAVVGSFGTKICNPGTPFMPFEKIDWYEEGVMALTASDSGYRWTKTNLSEPEANKSVRTAELKLDADGNLEGLVTVRHSGHQATLRRRDLFMRSPNEREEAVKKSSLATSGKGEIYDISIEDFEESSKPYTYSYRVKIPNYASRTGKRIFIQPNFFQYGRAPLFSSSTRNYPIYFEYAWSEMDRVEIELPREFEPESVGAPNTIDEKSDLARLTNEYTYDQARHVLIAEREFYFGKKGRVLFPAESYAPIKRLFDLFQEADTHSIVLKAKG